MKLSEKELQEIDTRSLRNKNILLMGRIEHACQIAEWLCRRGFAVEGIIDNDKAKQGRSINGLPILEPKQALLPFRQNVYVIIYSPKYWEDMCAQVAGYGYSGERHVCVLDRPDLCKNVRLVKKGLAVYRKLQREYGRDVLVCLADCPLGDYYLLGLYFHQYCGAHHITNYVIAGTSSGIETLSGPFRFKAAKQLTVEESSALIRAWIFLGKEAVRLKPLTVWQGAFRFNPCQTRQKNGFTFMDTFTRMIYGLKDPVPRYPEFPKGGRTAAELFQENGLQPRRTVIVSPFSYSIPPLPREFWIETGKRLRERGYSVAVNAGVEREENFIPDTVTLRLGFADMMEAMELAGTIVGMRSGFFDITARAECRRIILYPPSVAESVTWNSTNRDFCGLKQMGLCGDAYEWTVEDPPKIQEKIIAVICGNDGQLFKPID